jgi:hypothetical protein
MRERCNVVRPVRDRRSACEIGECDGFVTAQRVENAGHPRQVGQLGGPRRVGGQIVLVGTPIIQAQRTQNVGSVPLGKVVIGLEVRHRTTPLSCNAIRNARSA